MSKRVNIMLAYPFDPDRLLKWPKPWLVQPKLEGFRCKARYSAADGKFHLFSSENNEFLALPHINEELRKLIQQACLSYETEFDGELYTHGMHFNDISSRVKRDTPHFDYRAIEYHLFDIHSADMQLARLKQLSLAENKQPSIQVVPTTLVYTLDELADCLVSYLDKGYEGFIVRAHSVPYAPKRVQTMMKYKPRKKDCYEITGFEEEISEDGVPKNALGALYLKDSRGEFFKVGSGSYLTRYRREQLWDARDTLPGKFAVIKFQSLTKVRKVPYFPVLISISNVKVD